MSNYQVVIGTFSKSEVVIGQNEHVYEAGDRLKLNLVEVDGQIYEFDILEEPNSYGFSTFIEPNEKPVFVGYWYNGGAGMEEVVEEAIEKFVMMKGAHDEG